MDNVNSFIAQLLADEEISRQITAHRLFEAEKAQYSENQAPWSPAIVSLLKERSIRLYSHQAVATDHIRAGHSVVTATPTASGKTFIYNLPVLEKFLLDPEARSLYIFPLKALTQDQLGAFNSLCSFWPKEARPTAAIYDGDTSDSQRRKIRLDPPTVMMTNPEMLHLGILPHHESWAVFLANLSYVIVDEAHTYRGVFGSHMAQVFRRLNRICAIYGAHPTYICSTATVGNPASLAASLINSPFPPVLVDKSGAPRGARHFVFIDPDQSASTCAIELLKKSIAKDLRVICYCRSRRMTELISLWAGSGPLANVISSYRAGYLPEERRIIEERMASGELKAVVSTSALELGIDIGGLDVCILVGYPGTITQTLQRGGRVGRSQRQSAVIMIAGEDALDQYFVHNPGEFFSRKPEKAVINPENEIILSKHLQCAAAESPLRVGEEWLENPEAMKIISKLAESGQLVSAADGLEWINPAKNPQRLIDLRGCGESYVIEDERGRVIGTVDGLRAWRETHPGAVYLHHGESFVIDDVDPGRMRVLARRAKVTWFTRTRGHKSTDILMEKKRASLGGCAVFRGRLRVSEFISGYEKRSSQGQRLLGITPLKAPPHIFETEGIWFVIPDSVRSNIENSFLHFMGSIHALEHAAIGLLPLEVMADRNDFGGISIPMHHQLGLPAIFIYDAVAGGAGLTRAAFENARDLLESVLTTVRSCACDDGCPSCIHSPKCGSGNRPLSKKGAIALLERVLAPVNDGDVICQNMRIAPPPDRIAPQQASGNISPGQKPKSEDKKISAFFQRIEEEKSINATAYTASAPSGYVVLDVETRLSAAEVGGWGNSSRMGVSVAVLYDGATDEFIVYEQHELSELFSRLALASLVVGFNIWQFDYSVLTPFAEVMGTAHKNFQLKKLPTMDLLRQVHRSMHGRVSLDNLASATLGASKSASGLQALRWWKEGRLDKIAAYCQKDVELTRDLYLYGLREKHLVYTNKAGSRVKIEIDFSKAAAISV